MSSDMTIDKFIQGLDQWGSMPETWPEPACSLAASLLEGSAAARRQLAQAQHIDALLAIEQPAPVALRRQILEHLTDEQHSAEDVLQRLADWFAAAMWKPAIAATCVLILGFTAGFVGDGSGLTNGDLDEISMLAFSDNYQEIDDAF
jgi:hypothetical protein